MTGPHYGWGQVVIFRKLKWFGQVTAPENQLVKYELGKFIKLCYNRFAKVFK